MFRESIAKLLHRTVGKLAQLGWTKSAAKADCAAESHPLDLELDAHYNPMNSKTSLTVVRQRNDVDPLYKRHDGYLLGSFGDNAESSSAGDRWRLGRYSPVSSLENMPSFLSTFGSSQPAFAKTLNGSRGRVLNETESLNMIMTSQLKLAILNRYVEESNQKIAAREALTGAVQAFDTAIAVEPRQEIQSKCDATEDEIENEICVFDDQFAQDFAASCDVKLSDPIDAELFPIQDQRISQPRSFAHLKALREEHQMLQKAVEELCSEEDSIIEEELTAVQEQPKEIAAEQQPVAQEPAPDAVLKEETPFQRLFSRRQMQVERSRDSKRDAKERTPKPPAGLAIKPVIKPTKPAAKPLVNHHKWTGNLYSLDENSNYFIKSAPDYSEVDQVDTIDLTPLLAAEEQKSQDADPWISSEPAIGDEPVAARQSPTEDELECIRYISSSTAQLHVLKAMAESPETAQYVLLQLAYHPDVDVRCAVADNTNSPVEARWLLAQDENQTVRYMIAENINTPGEVLTALANDDNSYISSRARRTLARLRGEKVVSVKFGGNVLRLHVS